MRKLFYVVASAFAIVIATAFIPNIFRPNCNIFGCVYGRGWPLPFYYSQFCTMGDVGCVENYISWGHLIINLVVITAVVLLLSKLLKRKTLA